MRRSMKFAVAVMVVGVALYVAATRINLNLGHEVGEVLDQYNGVPVYYNGAINQVAGRHVAPDGYNLGLRWQCVEFVKRYYHQRLGHRMPQDRGNAKDFFDVRVPNGATNAARGLQQFTNGAGERPQVDDLVVFAPWLFNRYGHVAIVSAVGPDHVEVIQQNPGPFGSSRERYPLKRDADGLRVEHPRLLGWLRLPAPSR